MKSCPSFFSPSVLFWIGWDVTEGMLLFLRIAICPAEMQIKIKKEGEEIFSATHGISPFDFSQSSIVGTNMDREIGEIFYQEK